MPKTAVITDTDSSLPADIARKFNIVQIPITVQFGEDSYKDTFDIDNRLVFGRIDKEGKFPTTSAPSPGIFCEAFQAAFDEGANSILCFNVSSEVSATYASAHTAAELFPGKDIHVIDTRTLCMAQGFMALAAAEAVARGESVIEALAAAERVSQRVHVLGSLATLKYLAMSGRVSQLAAGFANLLDMKPILSVMDGKLQMHEKVRTQSKSWARTVEITAELDKGCAIERMAILHVNALEAAQQFEKQLQAAITCPQEIIYAEINPGISIHTGVGLVGVAFVTK
jgi:DegV family protein with EDD domain